VIKSVNVADTRVASGRLTLPDKTEPEERSIERASGQHCEAVPGATGDIDPCAISTTLAPFRVPAAEDADFGLVGID
jgi:hypothetical protein